MGISPYRRALAIRVRWPLFVREPDWRGIPPLCHGYLIPALALTWRRLHDSDRSGAWFFIILVPLIGAIVLLIFTLLRAHPSDARFDE